MSRLLNADGRYIDPEQTPCDHGITFDAKGAEAMLAATPPGPGAVAFVAGNLSASEVRRLWPRLDGVCPKGCGFVGIAYASTTHYIAGDW